MDPIPSVQTVSAVGHQDRGTPRPKQPGPVDERAAELRKLRRASNDFESIFIAKLLKPMTESSGGLSSSGHQLGGDVMLSVAMERMAESIAQQGGVGLGDVLYESLKDRVAPDTSLGDAEHPAGPIPLARPEAETQALPAARMLKLDRE